MTIPAQNSILSIAPQEAKIGAGGTFTIGDYDWYKFRTPSFNVGAIQSNQIFPLETGGPIVPSGAYKDAIMFGGDADFLPRAEGDFGWLLYAAMGAVSTVPTTAGVTYYDHHFRFTADSFTIPWLAVRKFIPGVTGGDNFGEVGHDCKVASMRFIMPGQGLVAANVGFIGRDCQFVEAPSWTYINDLEDSTSVPVVGNGSFKIGGTSFPITALSVDFINGLSSPAQEMIVGSYRPDDFVPLTRALTGRFIYKYENPDLYQQIYAGSTSGTAFDPLAHIISRSGATPAIEGIFSSPSAMPGVTGSLPYRLKITCDKVVIQPGRPATYAGGGIIFYEYLFTALEPASGNQYAEIELRNLQSAYTWPT